MRPDQQRPVLVFDGICNLCHGLVVFILKNEKAPLIYFSALQSGFAKNLCVDSSTDSVLFIDKGRIYTESEAVFEICRYLRFPWNLLRLLRILPKLVSDQAYRYIARHRFRLFGRRQSCVYNLPGHMERFLE